MKLYGCLWVADFPVAVELRRSASSTAAAAVVFGGKAPGVIVEAANQTARAAGVRPGMTLAQAEGRWIAAQPHGEKAPPLLAAERDQAAEHRAQRELLDAALTVTPRIESAGPGMLALDMSGLRDVHASARDLAAQAEQLGLPANVAVSPNRFAAVAAAQTQAGVTHVYPDKVRGFLDSLAVEMLPLEEHERRTLGLWGVRTVGELARLSPDELTARFGDRGARLSKLARGESEAVLEAWEAPRVFEQHREFDWQIESIDDLSFPLADMLKGLCDDLARHGASVSTLRIWLKLADGSRQERAVALGYPLTDADTLLKLVRIELSAKLPGGAVQALRLEAQATPRRYVQHHLFERARPNPEKLAVTLTRIQEIVGPAHLGTPAEAATHRPGAFSLSPPFESNESGLEERRSQESPGVAFRRFRPPVEAEVVEEKKTPVYVSSKAAEGPVERCSGPWRTSGAWWTNETWDLAEWDVELPDGVFRLSCERVEDLWQVVGVYD